MKSFKRWTRIAHLAPSAGWGGVFVEIEWDDDRKRVSICGVEGPKSNGDAVGSSGQISLGKEHHVERIPEYDRLKEVWDRWHLNDMRAGCEHQRAEGWDKRPIDPSKPLNAYGKHFEEQRTPGWNMLTWVTPREHPEGLLGAPCTTCGYRYGTAWLKEDVPEEVLEFLASLPDDSDKVPFAWRR